MWWCSCDQVCLKCKGCWRYINHCERGLTASLVEIHGLMWTQHLSIRTSLVSTSTGMHCTIFPRWRCADSTSRPMSCVCDHVAVPKNFKFVPRKNFQMYIPPMHESVLVLLSDGYVTIQWPSLSEVTTTVIHRVRFQISWQLTGKGDSRQYRRHTDQQWHTVSEDTRIIRYWLLHYTASIGRVTIPNNRADHPTLNLHARTELIPSLDVLRFSAFLICVHCVRQVGNRP